ncbi:hypothetical protein PRZ48_008324 [Zasmidium cellare]|uniref:Uncharacterized protein n=1 Tax=Zasmidium cellare TaxID=395010 RepID=A0ABR0EGE3_ZASCE|nr:hypothetical protein PRZ48_008324 [Zasmidium cellare]
MASPDKPSSIPMGKGCTMNFKPSSTSHWTEVTYDGLPTSWIPSIPPHWHKHHAETMTVLTGTVHFTLNSQPHILTPTSPPLHIPRLAVHSFTFVPGVATVLKESTEPEGEFKEVFFRTLLAEGGITLGSVGRACWEGDTYLAVAEGWLGRGLDEWATWILASAVRWWDGETKIKKTA